MQTEGSADVRQQLAGSAPDTPLTAWLRTVLVGAVCIPLAAFVAVAWWGFNEAQHAAEATASRASALAAEHAHKALAIATDIAQRTAVFTAGPDEELRANEAALRQRLADLVAGLPSIVNLNVWGADGHPLVRSDQPVDPKASVADRRYFQEQRDPGFGLGVSEVITGRQTGKRLMNLTLRRPAPDGTFRGIVAVSLSPSFFRDHYRSLAADDPRLTGFAAARTGGDVLARWPAAPDGQPDAPLIPQTLQRVQAGETQGTHMVAERGQVAQMESFRRVPDYPVFVTAGFSRAAMLAEWARFVGVLAAITLPITTGLAYVTWLALRKTRLEQATASALREQIRRRSAAERSMLETQKLETLAVLTGSVAHDFNNLLAIVDTSLHIHRLKHPNEVDEPQLQAMSRAIRSGVRLTRQLLSFSRKQALKPETIQLQTWLPSAAELMRSTLGGQVTLEFVVEPDTRPVTVDVGELELSLINLALNARHAQPEGGSFKLVARNADAGTSGKPPMVEISAQDDGVGIPADMLPRVTEPFFTTREKGAGSGLGLSQVHGFCTQAGGSLSISSQPGQGTTVRMQLPATAVEPTAPTPAPPGAQATPLQGRLLLVEDNDEVATATRGMLSGSGLEVVHVTNAHAALDYLATAPTLPDVVLSDIAMPGQINGIGLAFRLRDERPGLPVLLTTGYAEQLSHAVSGGFEVLPKPTPPEDLLRRLRELVGLRP